MQTYGIFFNFQLSFWKFLFVAVNYAVSMRKRHYNSGSAGMRIAPHVCLDFNQALLGLQPRLTCTSINACLACK